MIGPEWVAQQKKLVATRMMNCGERSASASDISSAGAAPSADTGAAAASAGGRRPPRGGAPSARWGGGGARRRRPPHQERDRDHDRSDDAGHDQHRGPPV